MNKKRIRIKRKDGVKQRYWKNQGAFTKAHDTDPTELIAVKKFGIENLENLKRLGGGRDREVFALNEDKVLKIAKAPSGLSQNDMESDLGSFYFEDKDRLEHQETGKDYVVTERVDRDDKITRQYLKPLQELTQEDVDERSSKAQDAFNKIGREDLLNYDLALGDLKRPSSWGVRDGRPVIIDAGVLSRHTILPLPKTHEFNKKEWEEIKLQRRSLK